MTYISAAWAMINKRVKSNSNPRISENINKAANELYNLAAGCGELLDVYGNISEKVQQAPDFDDMCLKLMNCMAAAFVMTNKTAPFNTVDEMVIHFASTALGDYKAFCKFVLSYLKSRIKAEIVRQFCLDRFSVDILNPEKAKTLFDSKENIAACAAFCSENNISNPESTIKRFKDDKVVTEFGMYFLACYGRQSRYAAIMLTVIDEKKNIIGSSSENYQLWEKIKDFGYERFGCDNPKELSPNELQEVLEYVRTLKNFHRYTLSELGSFIMFHGISIDTENLDAGTTEIPEVDDTELIMSSIAKMKNNSAFRPDDFEMFTIYIVHFYFKSGWEYDTLINKLVWLSENERRRMLEIINSCADENIPIQSFGKLLGIDMTSYSNAIARVRKKLCDINVLLK